MLRRFLTRFRLSSTPSIAILLCLTIFASGAPIPLVIAANGAGQKPKRLSPKAPEPDNGKARKVKPAAPDKNKPNFALPNLDELRAHRESQVEMKPAQPSVVRSKRKPLQKWDGRKVGDPGTSGPRSQARRERGTRSSASDARTMAEGKFNHSRRSAKAAAPPLPDDSFVVGFVGNALGRGINGTEQTYWDDILRSAYYQGPDALFTAGKEMGRTIFQSQEYYNRGRSNHDYVFDLYMTYLMRDPTQPYNGNPDDIGGWNFWTGVCNSNGREAVRAAFDSCGEFYNKVTSLTPNGGISGSAGSMASARVDPFNQTGSQIRARDAEWNLPLISLPGRAGLDLGLSLGYSSLVWTKSGPYLYFDEDVSQLSPGFHLGFAAIQGPTFDPISSRKVFVLVASAGSRVELRQVNSSSVYEAADSSYLQLTDNGNDTLTLRTTDGTQISYSHYASDWQATQIKDRNGNYISIGNDWRGDINTITDTLGRVIYFNNDGNGNLNSITQYWNGGWHTWANFSWGSALSMDTSSVSGVVGTYYGEQIPVVRGVSLADGSFYGFDYRGNGQVSVIRRYSSDSVQRSYVAYDYENPSDDCPRIYQKRVWADAWIGSEVVTQFNLPGDGSHQMVTPDQTVYREYYGSGWQNGLVTDARVYASGLQRQTTTAYTQDNTGVNYQMNPRVTETNIYDSAGNRRRKTIEYHSSFGLPHYIVEYAADGFNFLRRTHLEYKFDSQYIDRRIIGLPYQREVYDNNWTMMERTQYAYDWGGEFMQDLPAAPTQHDGGYHAGFISGRGNLAAVDHYDVFDPYNTSKIHEVQTGYDVAGNLRFNRDAAGHTGSISYNDQFSDYGNGRNTFAYPTTLTDADGYSSYLQYNYDFGAKTFTQSPAPAGQPYGLKQYFYYDNAARLYDTYNENSGARTSFGYGPNYSTTQASVNSVYDNYSFRYFDGLGRETVASTYHSTTGTYGTQLTYYDVMGRVSQQSNPTEMYGNWSPSADEAGGWIFSYQTYDWKGRPLVTTNQDGIQKYASYNSCGCAGSEVVTLTDERGRQQRAYSDVLGRQYKTEVLNWNGTVYSTTESSLNARDQAFLVRQTDNGTGAYQDTAVTYDGYGRLKTKHSPEQNAGAVRTYAYNNDDTVYSVSDARGASATYGYNNRHLVTAITYSAPAGITATSNASFGYDAAGNRTSMNDGYGSKSYSYDQLSRMTAETRYFSSLGQYHTLSYNYNLAGQPTSITDATGMTINYGYDSLGRLNVVSGSNNVYAGVSTYAYNYQYRAWGALKGMTDGTSHATSIAYNWKLLPSSFDVSGVVHQNYDYWNDGRLSVVHNTTDANFDRSYSYDQSGRLIEAKSGSLVNGFQWAPIPYYETFTYDTFDNLTNRYSTNWGDELSDDTSYSGNRRSGWDYDADGRNTAIGTRSYTYDAAGRMTLMTGQRFVINHYITTNQSETYDGDGVKISENTTGLPVYYLRSTVMDGAIIEELDNSGQKSVGYVYASGQLLAQQSSNQVTWKPITVAGSSQYDLPQGGGVGRVEFDGVGADIGVNAPFTSDTGGQTGDLGGSHYGGIMDARWSNFFDQGSGCSKEGVAASCSGVPSPDAYMQGQMKSFFKDSWYDLPGNNNEIARGNEAWERALFITTTLYKLATSKPGNTTDPAEIAAYQEGLADLLERILTRDGCADVYGGVENAVGVLAGTSISYANIGYFQQSPAGGGTVNVRGVEAITTTDKVIPTIEINRYGSFGSSGQVTAVSAWPGPGALPSSTFQMPTHNLKGADWSALVLAHELGHVVGIYGDNDIDGGDQTKSDANTQKVFDACFK